MLRKKFARSKKKKEKYVLKYTLNVLLYDSFVIILYVIIFCSNKFLFFFTKERIASNVKISQSVSSHRES